jgi:hypothetical protein
MSNNRIITDICGFIEENEEGNESIFPIFNGAFYIPYIGNEDILKQQIKFIKSTYPYKTSKKVTMVKFSHRIDLQRIK